MASVIDTPPFNEYTANGATTVFAYEFQVLSSVDMVVRVNGVVIATSAYTLSGVGDLDGGAVTFTVAPANLAIVLLSREMDLSRDTDYQYNGDLREDVVDRDFNRLWLALQGVSAALENTVRTPINYPLIELPNPTGFEGRFLGIGLTGQPAYLPAPTGVDDPDYVTLRKFGVTGGAGDHTDGIQEALLSGAGVVRAGLGPYNISDTIYIPDGVTLLGQGMAKTQFNCAANITPFAMNNVNDAAIEGALIVANAVQTNAIFAINATTQTIARCRIEHVQCSGFATDFPFISLATAGANYGNWAHLFKSLSVSGCGTIFRAETTTFESWINSIQLSHVYANDFIRGVHIIPSGGEGCSDSTFFDISGQTSPRTQFGANIQDVGTQGYSRKNSFTDVKWYDLINGGGQAYIIGVNVLDTTIQGHIVDDPSPLRIIDRGIGTQINGQSPFAYFTRKARREVTLSTSTGLTQDVSGTGTTASIAPYIQLRTGATGGSLARRYSTDPVSGLSQNQIFNTNFSLPLRFTLFLARITTGGSAIGRVQFKRAQADGSLAAPGIGLQINNYAVFGESYGSSLATVNLGLTMVDAEAYKIDIYVYPALRVEWWVNGVLAGVQTTVANVPSGLGACYFHSSLANVAANDVQMFITPPELAAGI